MFEFVFRVVTAFRNHKSKKRHRKSADIAKGDYSPKHTYMIGKHCERGDEFYGVSVKNLDFLHNSAFADKTKPLRSGLI